MKCDMCGETIRHTANHPNHGIVEYIDSAIPRYLCHECMEAVIKVIDEHYDFYVKLVDDDGERRQS